MPLASTGMGDFGLTGSLTYTHGKNLDTGDGLYNIMPLNGKLALTHALGGWKGVVEIVAVAAKDDLSDVRNETRTAGYGLTNLRGSYTWKQVRLDLGGRQPVQQVLFAAAWRRLRRSRNHHGA
jgi:iron complex outermembrane receptor protein